MKVTIDTQEILTSPYDGVVLFTHEEGSDTENRYKTKLGRNIVVAREKKEFEGKPKQIFSEKHPGTPRFFLLVGLGKKKDLSADTIRACAWNAAHTLRNAGAKQIAFALPDFAAEPGSQAIVEGAILGTYQFNKYKTQKLDEIKELASITIIVKKEQLIDAKHGVETAQVITDACILARDLQNTPSCDMTPQHIASQALELGKSEKLKVTVLDKGTLAKQGYGGMLSVGKGSSAEPRLVTIEYSPKSAKRTIALVGKGITFDSGGISLKPGPKMAEMKYDMSGAAVVLATMRVVSKLKLPVKVVGVLCLAENMPDGGAYKPGDVVKTKSGKTVEVDNTDAEGRIVLADGLHHANTCKPDAIIDLATLTGAVVVALGDNAAGALGNNQQLIDALLESSKQTGEKLWQLPLWDEYAEDIKSSIADVKNVGIPGSAGTISGAMFLKEFVGDTPWVHLDIAGVAWTQGRERHLTQNGGTSFGVRLLTNYLQQQ